MDEQLDGAKAAPAVAEVSAGDGAQASQAAEPVAEPVAHGEAEQSELPELPESVEDEAFWEGLRERVISWRTMKPQQRLITGAAIAQVIAAGLIIALHGIPAATYYMGMPAGHGVQMAIPFFWASLIFLIVSLGFLMTGALMLRGPIRLLALVALSALTLFPPEASGYSAFRLVMVALLWLWAGVAAFAQLRGEDTLTIEQTPARPAGAKVWEPLRRMRAHAPGLDRVPVWRVTFAFLLAWQALLYLALLASSGWAQNRQLYIFQLTVATQLQSLIFVLIPFLFLAGSDFAELGELIASGVAKATRAPRVAQRGWLTLGLTLALALVIAITSAPNGLKSGAHYALAYLGEFLVAGAVALILYALLRWGRAVTWVAPKAGPAMLLLVTLGQFAALGIGLLIVFFHTSSPAPTVFADYSVYRSSAPIPTFSMVYPTAWTTLVDHSGNGETAVSFNGIKQTLPGAFFVDVQQRTSANANAAEQDQNSFIARYLARGSVMTVTATGTDGPWHTQRFTLTDSAGKSETLALEGWSRSANGYDFSLIGLALDYDQAQLLPVFAQMTHSWRPDSHAQLPNTSQGFTEDDAVFVAALFQGLIPLMLGVGLGFWLVRRGRAHHRAWQVAGVFVAALGLLAGAPDIPVLLRLAGAKGNAFWFLALTESGAQQVIAIATIALVIYVALRQRASALWLGIVRLALALNIGLLFIALIYDLYDKAIEMSKSSTDSPLSWAAALIVVIALGWDLLMSGETFTNRDDHLPRSTRLLLYLGYITLTATLVMFFSAQTYTVASGPNTSVFESEPWPQLGLLILGPPMVVTTFALATAEWVRHLRRQQHKAASQALEVVAQVEDA